MTEATQKKVRFIKVPNLLKQKVGMGGIDETLLEKAQETINASEYDFIPYAKKFLQQIETYAEEIKSNDNFHEIREKLVQPVMQLKANGGMFQYQMVSDVADIALQFLESAEIGNKDTYDVLKAHEKTLKIIIANKLKGDGGREGYALIKELDQACQRYFEKHGRKKEA